MLPKLLTFSITAFWLASVGWLCAVVWAPAESRMAEVDPAEIYRVFFSWDDSTTMTVLESGQRRGEVSVSGSLREDPEFPDQAMPSLSLAGSVYRHPVTSEVGEVQLFWRGVVDFTEEMETRLVEASFRMPSRNLTASMTMEGNPAVLSAQVYLNRQEVFSVDGASSFPGAVSALPFMALAGADIPGLDWLAPGTLANLSLEAQGRVGNFNLAGRDVRAYLLILSIEGHDESLRIFLSETGEPLRIVTEFGVEAVSEILVPLDAYRGEGTHRPFRES